MARCYPGTVLLEGTTLSEGRGTTRPLELFGAPELDAHKLIAQMRAIAPRWLQGCRLRPCWFEPTFHKHAGKLWVPRLTNDLLGVGFVWSQPSSTTRTVYHENEYVFETFYTLQLSPTSVVQPDLQIVWNPAFNPTAGPVVVFQFQFVVKW